LQYENILVIQTSFIGDVILSTSLLESLHLRFPLAKIDIVVRKGNEGLLFQHPFLSEVLLWDKKNSKYSNLFKLMLRIRRKKYDLVFNLQRFASTGLLTGFSGATKKIGFKENFFSFLFHKKVEYGFSIHQKNVHEIERYHQLLQEYVSGEPSPMKLYPDEASFEKVKSFQNKKYVIVSPASVWFTKQYPKEKWVELINHLPVEFDVYLLGGKNDEELCEYIRNQSKNFSVRNLAGKLSFLESAALIAKAEMTFSNDSGPQHIASAMNAPITTVFLSTLPDFGFGPRSIHSKIVQTIEKLDCRPCGVHGHKQCPKGHFKCAEIDYRQFFPE